MDISHTKERIIGKFCVLWSEEINLKVESSFLLNMTKKKKTFEHNKFRDNILYTRVHLTPLYSDDLPSLISTKTPLLKIAPSAI